MNKIIIDAIEVDSKPNGIYTRLELTDYRIVEEEELSEKDRFSEIIDKLSRDYKDKFIEYIDSCVDVETFSNLDIKLQKAD